MFALFYPFLYINDAVKKRVLAKPQRSSLKIHLGFNSFTVKKGQFLYNKRQFFVILSSKSGGIFVQATPPPTQKSGGGGEGIHPPSYRDLRQWMGVPLGVENATLSQSARCTKNTPCHNYTLLKMFICIYPVATLHRRWCPDRRPVGWEPGWEATL